MKKITRSNVGFDWVAPIYDQLASAVFGKKLQKAQLTFLTDIPEAASILLVGGGTGWLLEQILVQCKPRRVLYLEASAKMVALASRRMAQKPLPGTVEFRVDDQLSLHPNEQFDVVITPFLLDLFTEKTVQSWLIPRLRHALRPNGRWLITDFVQTRVWWQIVLLWTMIHFFRLAANIQTKQLVDWPRLLAESGLALEKRQTHVAGMVVADVWRITA
ncbi:class I SAM-dependent methyltransferase [Spirosoma sp. RP8]|uniref:Class I SAM-dependent methyltransferase n=1 Tax=Spirosoma liriopis TaxID=2937440 RepID=A0ABT0HQ62_9BACT|nr:class I SAM-dependent methyltransferase [Spirosoma liriopis]MCK8494304.1 class I SAM-dependent methyltransferase [Spirosoma liriopis]